MSDSPGLLATQIHQAAAAFPAIRRARTQAGRRLRRYGRRGKLERRFAWLFHFRRLGVRHEYHAENFPGFVHRAAGIIRLRH